MGFYFRKSKKILPGLRVNASKSGYSFSIGTRGNRITYGKRGVTRTIGIPGSGAYHREFTSYEKLEQQRAAKRARKQAQKDDLNDLIGKQPIRTILSLICLACAIFIVILPDISWWWLLPSLTGGIFFLIWAEIRRDASSVSHRGIQFTMSVHIQTFLKKYYAVLPPELYEDLKSQALAGNEFAEVPKYVVENMNAMFSNTYNPDNNSHHISIDL